MEEIQVNPVKGFEPSNETSPPQKKSSDLMKEESWGRVKEMDEKEMIWKGIKMMVRFWKEMMGNLIQYAALSTYHALATAAHSATDRLSPTRRTTVTTTTTTNTEETQTP